MCCPKNRNVKRLKTKLTLIQKKEGIKSYYNLLKRFNDYAIAPASKRFQPLRRDGFDRNFIISSVRYRFGVYSLRRAQQNFSYYVLKMCELYKLIIYYYKT